MIFYLYFLLMKGEACIFVVVDFNAYVFSFSGSGSGKIKPGRTVKFKLFHLKKDTFRRIFAKRRNAVQNRPISFPI